jgi:lipopolysaccharide biosynthesis regulator YciM
VSEKANDASDEYRCHVGEVEFIEVREHQRGNDDASAYLRRQLGRKPVYV